MKLEELVKDNGQPVTEWLDTQPVADRELLIEAIYACLKKGWPLNPMTIQSTARAIDRKQKGHA